MRWLGSFTNKTFRKHRKLIFPHTDFMICIVSLAIFHPHFSIRIFHPHFIIRIFLSAIRHPPSAIRRHPPPSAAIRSSLYRDPIGNANEEFSLVKNVVRPITHANEENSLVHNRGPRVSLRLLNPTWLVQGLLLWKVLLRLLLKNEKTRTP